MTHSCLDLLCFAESASLNAHNHPAHSQARTMPLFSLTDHANTLAPFKPNELLVTLHNLGNVSGVCRPVTPASSTCV